MRISTKGVATVVFIAVFSLYFLLNIEDFAALKNVSIIDIALLFVFNVITILVNSLFLIVIIKPFNVDIRMKVASYITVLSTIGNYVTPFRGGAGIRAVYLKRKFSLPYDKFLATLAGNYIIVFCVVSLLGLIAVVLKTDLENRPDRLIALLFLGTFLFTVITIITNPSKRIGSLIDNFVVGRGKFVTKFLRSINGVFTGWDIISTNKSLIGKLIFLVLLNYFTSVIQFRIAFGALGIEIDFLGLLIYVSISAITLLISLTPGALGIKEAVLLFFSSVLGVTNQDVLNVAVLDRGVLFITLIILYIATNLNFFGQKEKDEEKST